MMEKSLLKRLKLTKSEARLLKILTEDSQLTVADVAKSAKIPRMTAHITLQSLKERGLADYKRRGKRKYWHLVDDPFATATTSEITFFQGKDALYEVWAKLLSEPPNTRVLCIQPTTSLLYSLPKLSWSEKTSKLQKNILEKPIIVDGILPEDYYPMAAQNFSKNPKQQREFLESFIGRGTSITFLPSEYFKNTEAELIILPQAAYLNDWKNEVGIEIKNKAIIGFLKECYELIKTNGKKVDQNNYLKKLIDSLAE